MPDLTLERIAELREQLVEVLGDECWRMWACELRQGPKDDAEYSKSRHIASFALQKNETGRSHVAPLYLVQAAIAALPALLDAAEQWLKIKRAGEEAEAIPPEVIDAACAESQMQDRKAAAFDAMIDIAKAKGEVRVGYREGEYGVYWYDDSCLLSSDDHTKIDMELIETDDPIAGIEALALKLKEPSDAQ